MLTGGPEGSPERNLHPYAQGGLLSTQDPRLGFARWLWEHNCINEGGDASPGRADGYADFLQRAGKESQDAEKKSQQKIKDWQLINTVQLMVPHAITAFRKDPEARINPNVGLPYLGLLRDLGRGTEEEKRRIELYIRGISPWHCFFVIAGIYSYHPDSRVYSYALNFQQDENGKGSINTSFYSADIYYFKQGLPSIFSPFIEKPETELQSHTLPPPEELLSGELRRSHKNAMATLERYFAYRGINWEKLIPGISRSADDNRDEGAPY